MTEEEWSQKRGACTPEQWVLLGKPVPPPDWYKHWYLLSVIRKFGVKTFVETGTYLAETTRTILPWVDLVYTFELDKSLWEKGVEKLSRFPHVVPLYGDSTEGLRRVIPHIPQKGPALFWLDAHYSGKGTSGEEMKTAINGELDAILEMMGRPHITVIDDMRGFGKSPGYPTVDEVVIKYKQRFPCIIPVIKDDMMTVVVNL